MAANILLLPGDGIGPEVIEQAAAVLRRVSELYGIDLQLSEADLGGIAIDRHGDAYPPETQRAARAADALLMGAVGGPKWDGLAAAERPEKGLLRIRADLELFGNLRPALLYPQLAAASSLKPELVAGLDIMIVRELTGGLYFGEPRGIRTLDSGEREGFNTYRYAEGEIERIARLGFDIARRRDGRLCSIDKANVLEVTMLWREVLTRVGEDYPDVSLSHMYVDNAAMQLVREPKQFDVIVTGNLFGDILSDTAAMLTGSIGMLPSASLDANAKGLYEPVHGSAPDIAGQGKANPLATILSVAMMLRYTFGLQDAAGAVETAVASVLDKGLRTGDIGSVGCSLVSTTEMGDAVVAALA